METPWPPELLAWPWPPADAKAIETTAKTTKNSFCFMAASTLKIAGAKKSPGNPGLFFRNERPPKAQRTFDPRTLVRFLPSGLYRRRRNFTGSVCGLFIERKVAGYTADWELESRLNRASRTRP
jgi:hypothetical protein